MAKKKMSKSSNAAPRAEQEGQSRVAPSVLADQLREPLEKALSPILEGENPLHAELDEKIASIKQSLGDVSGETKATVDRLVRQLESEKAKADEQLRRNLAEAIATVCLEMKIPVQVRTAGEYTGPIAGPGRRGRGLRRGGSLTMLKFIEQQMGGSATTADCMGVLPDKDNQAVSQVLTNLKSKGYLDAKKISGQKGYLYTVTELGRQELARKEQQQAGAAA